MSGRGPGLLRGPGDLAMGFPGLAPQAVYLCLVCIVTRVLQGPRVVWKGVVSTGPQEHWPLSWGLRHRWLVYPGAFHVWGLFLLFTIFIHVFKALGGRIGLKSETQNLQVCGWEVACRRRHRVCPRPVPSRTWPWALRACRPELLRASSGDAGAADATPPCFLQDPQRRPQKLRPFPVSCCRKTPGASCLSGQQGGRPGRGMRCVGALCEEGSPERPLGPGSRG